MLTDHAIRGLRDEDAGVELLTLASIEVTNLLVSAEAQSDNQAGPQNQSVMSPRYLASDFVSLDYFSGDQTIHPQNWIHINAVCSFSYDH